MADDEGDNNDTVTILQFQAQIAALEREALEAFPDEPDECSWANEQPSQPVYVCATCTPDGNAGICYSCSIRCHAEHTVHELWDKRDFKCDCGTTKFGDAFQCSLMPKRGISNPRNRYNHNFVNRYCVCDKPYDPAVDALMFKCTLCEDWFHDRCLAGLPSPADFRQLICAGCADKHAFLRRYEPPLDARQVPAGQTDSTRASAANDSADADESGAAPPSKRARVEACRLSTDAIAPRPLYLPADWRARLCRCDGCRVQYLRADLDDVLDPSRTPAADAEDDGDEEEQEDGQEAAAADAAGSDARPPTANSDTFEENPSFQMALQALRSQPAAVAAAVEDRARLLMARLRPFLEEAARNGQVVTAEMIHNALRGHEPPQPPT